MKIGLGICFTFLVVAVAIAQEPKKPALIVTRVTPKIFYAPTERLDLTVTIENRGKSAFYLFGTLEWGWTGLWYGVLDTNGKSVPLKQKIVPAPPIPLSDKSELVELEPGYFYGTHLNFNLSEYDLKPGTYFIEFGYQSYYDESEAFGLPILTPKDGEIVSNRIQISIR